MVRPGPKTYVADVKTAILDLLKGSSDGLNFNEIFRRLKEQEVLGSFSVLSHALEDLYESRILTYKEVKKSKYKIPMKIYSLTEKTRDVFSALDDRNPKSAEYAKTTDEVSADLLADIKKPSEAALLSVLLRYARGLTVVYKQIIEERGEPNGLWNLLLHDVTRSEREYMEARASWARSGKAQMRSKQELEEILNIISKWIELLTMYGISLQANSTEEHVN